MRNYNSSKDRGVYTVEFAIVGSLFFLILFAIIEIGRLMFTWNLLTESSRRGARLAVVCQLDDSNILSNASFSGSMLANLKPENIRVSYLNNAGVIVAAGSPHQIRLVQVDIINYQHQLLIPGAFLTLNSPNFSSVLPRESLGALRGEIGEDIEYSACS